MITKMITKIIAITVVLVGFIGLTSASDVNLVYPKTLELTGRFVMSDTLRDLKIATALGNADTLILNSGGGDAMAGVEVSMWLQQRKDMTVIVNNRCASACFTAFVGGRHRVLMQGASLAYHGAGYSNLNTDRLYSARDINLYSGQLKDITALILESMIGAGVNLRFATSTQLVKFDTMNFIHNSVQLQDALKNNVLDEIIEKEQFVPLILKLSSK